MYVIALLAAAALSTLGVFAALNRERPSGFRWAWALFFATVDLACAYAVCSFYN